MEEKHGVSQNCPELFNRTHTLETWTASLFNALKAYLAKADMHQLTIYALGVSDGAAAVARLAGDHPGLFQKVGLHGASGSTQLYDFVLLAHKKDNNDEEKRKEVAELDRIFSDIQSNPDSTEKIFAGHPYKRWSSFFKADAADELLRSQSTPVYLITGMQDASVPVESTELLWSKLRAHNHPVVFRRVPEVDHGLMPVTSENDWTILNTEYTRALDWLIDSRSTEK